MAFEAHTTPETAGKTDFRINGATPFQSETAEEYIFAAHAVACLGAANAGDQTSEFYSTTPIIVAGFDAISLLLSHAARLLEGRH